MGKTMGISEDQIRALTGAYLTHPAFSEAERVAIRWAELVTKNDATGVDDLFEFLSKHYDTRGIVELTVIVGIWNMTNRFTRLLRVPLEPWREEVLRSCFFRTDGNIPTGDEEAAAKPAR